MLKWALLGLLISGCSSVASSETYPLDQAPIDRRNKPSLQRGFRTFMNYCSGCHGLKYLRYKTVAKDLGMIDEEGQVLEEAIQKNLMFVGQKITDPIQGGMSKTMGEAWFGTAPPDLSLEVRIRGVDWIYTYLNSFYADPKRPWGVNNAVFPGVSMPHVLELQQGLQTAVEKDGRIAALKAASPGEGRLSPEAYKRMTGDLVNFLAYAAEPSLEKRQHWGVGVMLFCSVFALFGYLLKREYWKDVD